MSDPAPVMGSAIFSKHRLEALSDGVFAVVMTLLVLEIKPELEPFAGDEAVAHTLRALALPLLAYAFTFLISCIFWNLHHRKFTLLRHTNTRHTALTLVFLFAVTLLPVSISIYIRAKSSALAHVVYFGNFTLIAFSLLLSWLYARRAGLADPAFPGSLTRNLSVRMFTLTLVGVIAMLASYFDRPYLFMLVLPVILYLRRRKLAAS